MSRIFVVAIGDNPLLTTFGTFLEYRNYQATLLNDLTFVKLAALMLKPDLIIIDLLLDDEAKSLELVKELREEGSPVASIPIILSSTENKLSTTQEQSLKGENIRVIPKPFDTPSLVREIEAALASSDQEPG